MIRDFFRKDFFKKQSIGMKIARSAVVASISLIIVCLGIDFYFDRDVERFKASAQQKWREQAEIRAEAKRRNSVKEKTETGSIADAKTAMRKRHEWELRRKELRQRQSKNGEQSRNLAIASTKRGDDERALMLSVYKLMPEAQREQVHQQLLQTEPADKVNAFFDNMANAPTKTQEPIKKDAKDILESREAFRAAYRELQIEREQILLELAELDHSKPF